jgi:hypothetical protein
MIERVKVKLIKPWSGRRAGQVFDAMDKRTADLLIERGVAVLLDPPKRPNGNARLKPNRPISRTLPRNRRLTSVAGGCF